MPRRPPTGEGEFLFHVFNRAVQGLTLFPTADDYAAFMALLRKQSQDGDVRILGFALMPTHWHFLLQPMREGALSSYMQRLTSVHARCSRRFHRSSGRGAVYQGRFKALPVEANLHALAVGIYIEQNPLRAGLVADARDWPYSSCSKQRPGHLWPQLWEWPVPKPPNWNELLNAPESADIVQELRRSLESGAPFGSPEWREKVAGSWGPKSHWRRLRDEANTTREPKL